MLQKINATQYRVSGLTNITGNLSWKHLYGSSSNDTVYISKLASGMSGTIDLGNGTNDAVHWRLNGLARVNLVGVEFLYGFAPVQGSVQLMGLLGNTLTTDGSLRGLYGGVGNDNITVTGNRLTRGGNNDNHINLGGGNDTLTLVDDIDRQGTDSYDGGTGDNVLNLKNTTNADITYTFNSLNSDIDRFQNVYLVNTGTANINAQFTAQAENLIVHGTTGNDSVTGGDGADVIFGKAGYDVIDGHDGNDTIYSGTGALYSQLNPNQPGDRLYGGAGRDSFYVGYNDAVTTGTNAAVIFDWHAGQDSLFVTATSTAVIEGLYDQTLTNANTLDLRSQVSNDGTIVARTGDGNDTLYSSAGNDYLYGGKGTNTYNMSAGNDRVYIDSYQSKAVINDFTAEGGADDVVYLDQRIITAFGGTIKGGTTGSVVGLTSVSTTDGQDQNKNLNYLYDHYYYSKIRTYGAGPYTNDQHSAAHNHADHMTNILGGVSIGAGVAVLIASFGLSAYGYVLIANGGFLLSDGTRHINDTYESALTGDLNLLKASHEVNTEHDVDNSSTPFLNFFGGGLADGDNDRGSFEPALEFRNHVGAIKTFVAVESDLETLIYLLVSNDRVIVNSEAIFIGEIATKGLKTADFAFYNGDNDIFNQTPADTSPLVTPTIVHVLTNNGSDVDWGNEASERLVNGDTTTASYLKVAVSFAPALGTSSKSVKLYRDGVLVTTQSVSSTSLTQVNGQSVFVLTDPDPKSSTFAKIDGNALTADNEFNYISAVPNYTVSVTDPDSGLAVESAVFTVNVDVAGTFTIDGGNGTDVLYLDKTSLHLNSATLANQRIQNIEIIDAVGASNPVNIDLSNLSAGFEIRSSDASGVDTLVGSSGSDTFSYETAAKLARDNINGMGGIDAIKFTDTTAQTQTVADADFDAVNSVEKLYLAGSGGSFLWTDANNNGVVDAGENTFTPSATVTNTVTLDLHAKNAGITSIYGVTGIDVITVGSNYGTTGVNVELGTENDKLGINSGAAADTIYIGSGDDSVQAGAGNDTIYGEAFVTDADTLAGEAGADTLILAGVYTGGGAITAANLITGIENFTLESQTDLPGSNNGFQYNITLDDGNDADTGSVLTIDASTLMADADTTQGGAQEETLWFSADSVTSYSVSVTGGAGSDTLIGGSRDDTLTGGAGDDSITGGSGNSTIRGGEGADIITLLADTNYDLLNMSSSDGGANGVNDGWDVIRNFNGSGTFTDLIEISDWTDRSTGSFVGQGNITVDSSNLGYLTSTMGSNIAVINETELLIVSDSAVTSISEVKAAIESSYNLSALNDGNVLFSVKGLGVNEWWFGIYNDAGSDDTTSLNDFKILSVVTVTGGGFDFDDFWQPGVLLNIPPEVNARAVENGVLVSSNEAGTVNIGGQQVDSPNISAGGTAIIGQQSQVRSGIASVTDSMGASGDARGDATWLPGDTIYGLGTSGQDTFAGNYAWGFGGNDILNGTSGSDFLSGGSGDDVFNPGAGSDHIYTGGGSETVNLTVDNATDRIYFSAAIASKISGAGSAVPVGTFYDFSISPPASGGDLVIMEGVSPANRQILTELNAVANPFDQDDLEAAFSGQYTPSIQAILIMHNGTNSYIYFWSDAGSGDMTPQDDVYILAIIAGIVDTSQLIDNVAFI